MGQRAYFSRKTFQFLKDLASNNNREWFAANKHRYEEDVKDPALRFINDFAPTLKKISPHFRADPRGNGGSLFRIYRDTRFSKDKSPYKTYTGIQFRHEAGKDAHAPGFYLHLNPGELFMGCGSWRPDGPTLKKIREALAEDGAGWKKAIRGKRFTDQFDLWGDSLVRAPKGYDPDHPMIEDLRRKDFIAGAKLTQREVTSPDFMKTFAQLCRASAPFQRWLCSAVGVGY